MTYLSLGSNVGDRMANLQNAVDLIKNLVGNVTESSIYETKPWGNTKQPDYLNLCVSFKSEIEAILLLQKMKSIEKRIGRTPSSKWGPREIDIDIILHNNQQIDTTEINLPHKYWKERAFVCIPLLELAIKNDDKKLVSLINIEGTTNYSGVTLFK